MGDRAVTWRHSVVLMLLLGTCHSPPGAAAPPNELTPAEVAQVNTVVDGLVQQCKSEVLPALKDHAANSGNSAAPGWVAKLTPESYCTCIGTRVRSEFTPAALRTGTQADGEALIKRAANTCAVENFKTSFPEVCRSWSEQPGTAAQSQACACVQKRVDQVTSDTLAETVKETVTDYLRWQRDHSLPLQAGPFSLMSTYIQCAKDAGAGHP
jgi:hypothetical protein